jgi:hypothetical protein
MKKRKSPFLNYMYSLEFEYDQLRDRLERTIQERDSWRTRAINAEVKVKGLERGRINNPLEDRGRF